MSRPTQIPQRYFLRVFVDGTERNETEAQIFLTRQAAWDEAVTASVEILHEMDDKKPGMDWRMDVADVAGALLYRLSFKTEEFSPDKLVPNLAIGSG